MDSVYGLQLFSMARLHSSRTSHVLSRLYFMARPQAESVNSLAQAILTYTISRPGLAKLADCTDICLVTNTRLRQKALSNVRFLHVVLEKLVDMMH